tara:strand:+ start:1750 stop:2022 length:273 start_codon:yes stop_codon:yes gene_type:complete
MKIKNDIANLRRDIDLIDGKIFELLEKRFLITDEIGKFKLLHNIDIDDFNREEQIIERINSKMHEKFNRDEIITILKSIFSVSKNRQKDK